MKWESNQHSLAVADPEIDEVLDLNSGSLISARDVIGSDYSKAISLRMELRTAIDRGDPIYVCPLCYVPVHLVSRMEVRLFHFRHEIEDGRCPARTKGALSEAEINARKYNGAKESLAHIQMKKIVAESLRCDPSFSDVAVEGRWRGRELGLWRKPDVQAIYRDIRIAFEVQLSTTFLRIIAGRREFYLREKGLLLWIFKTFNEDATRLSQDDVFYNNNRNVFLVNEETLRISRETDVFTLECRWAKPTYVNGRTISHIEKRMVQFSELTLDRDRQRVFFFDYDRQAGIQASDADRALREKFESFWLSERTYDEYDKVSWADIRTKFRARGIVLPRNPSDGDGPIYLLNALYSAKYGQPIGWRFKKLIEVAHCIHDGHKSVFRAFRNAVFFFNRIDQILSEDVSGKWKKKANYYKRLLKEDNPEYTMDHRFDNLVALLFPEISELGKLD